ncbi:MAG: phospholipase D-like domain-containing protein [Silvibacterium sp.]
MECSDADWDRRQFTPGDLSHLIWCIGNCRQRIGQFIDEAKHTLWLQNERYQDPVIIERLVRANHRGVKVHVLARPPHHLKKGKLVEGVGGRRILDDVGVKVHKLKGLKLHANLLFADRERAIIGSIIWRRAVSTAAASFPSKYTTRTLLTACKKSCIRIGTIPTPLTSPTKDYSRLHWRTSLEVVVKAQKIIVPDPCDQSCIMPDVEQQPGEYGRTLGSSLDILHLIPRMQPCNWPKC